MAVELGVLEVAFAGSLAGKRWVNILHWRQFDNTGLAADAAAWALIHKEIDDAFVDALVPVWSNQMDYKGSVAKHFPLSTNDPDHPGRRKPVVDWEHNETSNSGAVGALGGDYLPSFNAVAVRKSTLQPGRSGRGVTHLAGLTEGNTSGQRLSTTGEADWAAASVGALLSTPSVNIGDDTYTYQAAVLSRKLWLAEVAATPPRAFAFVIQSISVNLLVGTMRRRKLKVL